MKVSFAIRKSILSVSAATCALAMPSFAYAQDSQGTDDAADEQVEIVVTAQKREQNLQDVPLAISAISAENSCSYFSARCRQMLPPIDWPIITGFFRSSARQKATMNSP